MGDNTMKKVIVVVLILMFLIPLFDSDVYIDQANSLDFATLNIDTLLKASTVITVPEIYTFVTSIVDDHKD